MGVGDVVALLAAGVAVWAVIVAHSANGRAREANDLQRRIDERAREYCDVEWDAPLAVPDSSDSPPALRLKNIGSTDAKDVLLILAIAGRRRTLRAGDIDAGQFGDVLIPDVPEDIAGALGAAVFNQFEFGYTLHWSSPLGAPATHVVPGRQIF